jgi:hypothetical protein
MFSNNIRHLISKTVTTLQHFATLHHTSPNYTSLHLSTLHFLSFTLHYPLICLNSFIFPTVLFHLTSLNYTQYSSQISKLISKIMNPFTALKNLSPFQFTFHFYYFFLLVLSTLHFTSLCYSYLQHTSLHFTSLHFAIHIYNTLPFIFYFLSPSLSLTGFHFHNLIMWKMWWSWTGHR